MSPLILLFTLAAVQIRLMRGVCDEAVRSDVALEHLEVAVFHAELSGEDAECRGHHSQRAVRLRVSRYRVSLMLSVVSHCAHVLRQTLPIMSPSTAITSPAAK